MISCDLAQDIEKLFAVYLRAKGLNLDANLHKKKFLIDFLLCLPKLLEAATKKNTSSLLLCRLE